ncbi:hypothetical protein BJ322DRAFT_74207 [Thelephora terrestris]|uniref:Transmembrane protein n=1 Tax=Thelephora terrestris TaxID=56493 RepID=A0A9P6HRW5_9AGAM|nr:hypothetical protein BJ322DRAFT_74207 [Thelephora terrestris]
MNANTKIPRLISRPFLVLRLVVFVVLLMLNILILSFAAFNITASRTWDEYVSAGSSLAVFNSSVFLFISMLLLGERQYSHAIPPVSMLLSEVSWVTFMAVLTFVSSVLSTRLGPAKMCLSTPVNMAMCSSSILVLPVSWMNFFIFFSYSVTLLIVTVLHAPFIPDIWHSTVSEIPWFDLSASPSEKFDLECQTVSDDASRSAHSLPGSRQNLDDQNQSLRAPPKAPWLSIPRGSFTLSVASFTPAWAKQHNVGLTRGLHNPFNRSSDEGSANHHGVPVQHPTRAITKPTYESRLHEKLERPFAAPWKHGAAASKVPGDSDKERSLQPLTGFHNLLGWPAATTSSESYNRDQGTGKQDVDRSSNTTVTTTTAVLLSPSDRRSVNSLFPHDVREEEWNLPVTKPPFRNGRGEGWTTAGAAQGTPHAGKGRGRR